ncbi:MAG: DegT/DnrJ/EryC1/StrS family aminotransferase [Candidatus Theseobacter exili]|nr:DegT/DnrJ/EryC1/StrS family aminotransferase [Candidatus Theseobacter exili]
MKIPFVDLKAQYKTIKNEIDEAIQSVIDETAFIKGKYVTQFEKAYAEKYGVKHCIGVANGTDAIYITLKALGVGKGDEVITVANSWISTSETISQTGARPVFVDIDPDYYTIDHRLIEEKITKNTKAILPVHLFGQPAEIIKIKKICDKYNLHLIEDCAQAHFAEYNNQKVGTFGIAGTFSFFPGKNLGAYGDAGAIISNDDDFAVKARMYANHGALIKHKHEVEGINSRLDGLQAAILSVKLKYISEWNEKRLKNATLYNKLLAGVDGIAIPQIRENVKHVFHLYVIRVADRDTLQKYLAEKGISTGIHYPTPLPFLRAYKYLGHKSEEFPVVSKYQDQILSLPMFPELTADQMEYVIESIKASLNAA